MTCSNEVAMAESAAVSGFKPGYRYKNGVASPLFVQHPLAGIVFTKSFDWAFGPLAIHASLDPAGPSASVTATLFGMPMGDCELNSQNQNCRLGGSFMGVDAEIDFELDDKPPTLKIMGRLTTPFTQPQTFDYSIPF